jgi:hypothetical protein
MLKRNSSEVAVQMKKSIRLFALLSLVAIVGIISASFITDVVAGDPSHGKQVFIPHQIDQVGQDSALFYEKVLLLTLSSIAFAASFIAARVSRRPWLVFLAFCEPVVFGLALFCSQRMSRLIDGVWGNPLSLDPRLYFALLVATVLGCLLAGFSRSRGVGGAI